VELLTTGDRGRLEPAVVEVLGEAIEQPVVGPTAEMNDRWRRPGGADACQHKQHLVVDAEEDVVLACRRGADLNRVDAEQRFNPLVWVLDDETDPASVGRARAQQLDEAGPGSEVGDDDLDPLDRCAQKLVDIRCGGTESVACAYPAIASPVACVARSPAPVAVGAGTALGQSACSVVSSAPATLVRCRGYGVRPASQRRTVLTSTWTTSANSSGDSPARVIAVLRCSFSKPSPTPKVAEFQGVECRCPKSSQDVLGDVPRCPCAVPDEHAW